MRLEGWHLIIIIVLALVLFAAPKLPSMARSIGQSMRIFKSEVREMKKDGSSEAKDSQDGSDAVEGKVVDYGFVGDIDLIDAKVLQQLLDDGLMPVVSPVSADDSGQLLNINADTVAAAIGAALKAEKLMLCTGAPGILESLDDPRSIISYTDLAGLKKLREEKKIVDGMLPKAKAIEDAIRGGVRRVHVMSYKSGEGILAEVFTNEGAGTLIVADVNALTKAEQESGK